MSRSPFSSWNFMVSGLTFKSLIHFELIFVSGVNYGSSFILLHVNIQFSQHHLLQRLSFLHCVFLAPTLILFFLIFKFYFIYFFIQQVLISYLFYTYQCIYVNPNLPVHHTTTTTPPLLSLLDVHTFVLYICVSISALQTGSSVPFFQVPHICVNIQYLFFSF